MAEREGERDGRVRGDETSAVSPANCNIAGGVKFSFSMYFFKRLGLEKHHGEQTSDFSQSAAAAAAAHRANRTAATLVVLEQGGKRPSQRSEVISG